MFEALTNDDIRIALDELIACIGVKQDMPVHDVPALLRSKDAQGCVERLSRRLGLPIRISLSYVPADFTLGSADRFCTTALARTNGTGQGIEVITAQVVVPHHIPMFGTSSLDGYIIQIRVSENCCSHPDTFVTIMAHELSHVLLASLRHPMKDSELHADPVPIILGLRNAIRRGRKNLSTTSTLEATYACTTTYGYLTDPQFEFASEYVTRIVASFRRDKAKLLKAAGQLRRRVENLDRRIMRSNEYLHCLDRRLPRKMRKEDTNKVIQLHSHDHRFRWERSIVAAKTSVGSVLKSVRQLDHYTNATKAQLEAHNRILCSAFEQIACIAEEVKENEQLLRRHLSIIHRLQAGLWALLQ